jgi:hypothetical protein
LEAAPKGSEKVFGERSLPCGGEMGVAREVELGLVFPLAELLERIDASDVLRAAEFHDLALRIARRQHLAP